MPITRVRIPQGFEEESDLKDKLSQNLGINTGEIIIEKYESKPNLVESFSERKESIANAFKFLAKALLPKDIDFDTYVEWCKTETVFKPNDSVDENKKKLALFTSYLVDAIMNHYHWPENHQGDKKKEATEMLNRAEQFYLLKQGRDDLITVVPFVTAEEKNTTEVTLQPLFKKWILLRDKQCSSFDSTIIEQFNAIKKAAPLQIPTWFSALPPLIQLYFHWVASDPIAWGGLTFSSSTFGKAINDLASLALDTTIFPENEKERAIIDQQIATMDTNPPDWFEKLSPFLQKSLLFLKSTNSTSKSLHKTISEISDAQIKLFLEMPEGKTKALADIAQYPNWYLMLPPYQQAFLKELLDEIAPENLSYSCSRLDVIPGLSHVGIQQLIDFNSMRVLFEELHSSNPIRRGILPNTGTPEILMRQFSETNLNIMQSIIEENSATPTNLFFYQTLINGEPYSLLKGTVTISDTDYQIRLEQERAINALQKPTIQVRHPLNYWQNWFLDKTPACESNGFLAFIKEHEKLDELQKRFKQFPEEKLTDLVTAAFSDPENTEYQQISGFMELKELAQKMDKTYLDYWQTLFIKHLQQADPDVLGTMLARLKTLAEEYHSILKINGDNYRELWLCSVENQACATLGILPSGTCMSGKDRKWIEMCHTMAIEIYERLYNCRPSYFDHNKNNLERLRYIDIFFRILETRHGHILAAYNARGAQGIKTLNYYAPNDILAKIERERPLGVYVDDSLADLNELSTLNLTTDLIKPSIHQILKLKPEKRALFLEKIITILNDKDFWHGITEKPFKTFFYAEPTGITGMKNGLKSSGSGFFSWSTYRLLPDEYKLMIIYEEARLALQRASTRDPQTTRFYTQITTLFNAEEPNQEIDGCLAVFEDFASKKPLATAELASSSI